MAARSQPNRYFSCGSLLILSTISLLAFSILSVAHSISTAAQVSQLKEVLALRDEQLQRANSKIQELNQTLAEKEKLLNTVKTEIEQLKLEITQLQLERNKVGSGISFKVEQNTACWTVIASLCLAGAGFLVLLHVRHEREKTERIQHEHQKCIRELQNDIQTLQQSNNALHDRINELQEQRIDERRQREQERQNRGILEHLGELLDRAKVLQILELFYPLLGIVRQGYLVGRRREDAALPEING